MSLEVKNYATCKHCLDLEKYKKPNIGLAKFTLRLFIAALFFTAAFTYNTPIKINSWELVPAVIILIGSMLFVLRICRLEFFGKKVYAFYDQKGQIHIHGIHPNKQPLGSWSWRPWAQRTGCSWRWAPHIDPADSTNYISGVIICFMIGGMWRSRSEFNKVIVNKGELYNSQFWTIKSGWSLTDIVLKDSGGKKLGHLPFPEILRIVNEFRNVKRYLDHLRQTEEILGQWLAPTILATRSFLLGERGVRPSKTAAHGRLMLEAGMRLCPHKEWQQLNDGQPDPEMMTQLENEIEIIVQEEQEQREITTAQKIPTRGCGSPAGNI